ncbi:MAG: DUF4416 family protein [Spirochaetales bacterium]|nr:DUF4416 family protein [Spirochaetales bacterium]
MGSIQPFTRAKLILGVLTANTHVEDTVISGLTSLFGPVDYQSEAIDFTFSHYYDDEMGAPIHRFFLTFEELQEADALAPVKLKTNALEEKFSIKGKRRLNLDPGFIFLSKLILATTKDGSQRIPLGSGIYGEITLVFEHKSFRPLELTYPDFRSDTYIHILNEVRNRYKEQLANIDALP